jgi:hypothetical protein
LSARYQWLTPIILATWEAGIRRIEIWGQPRKIFMILHLQTNQSKMDWKCGSSSRAPALQIWSPEFKPHFHQINKIGHKSSKPNKNLGTSSHWKRLENLRAKSHTWSLIRSKSGEWGVGVGVRSKKRCYWDSWGYLKWTPC